MSDESVRLDAAQALMDCGEWEEAAPLLDSLLADSPDWPEALELRARVWLARESFADALDDLEALQMLRPLSVAAQLAMAECYWRLNRWELARGVYRYLADEATVPPDRLSDLAKGLGRSGDPRRALAVCRQAVAAQPESHEAWFGVAYYTARAGAPDESLTPLLRQCVRLEPNGVFYRITLMAVLWRLKQYDEAYRVVAAIDLGRLRTISCECCLDRLRQLYFAHDDLDRAAACERPHDHSCD